MNSTKLDLGYTVQTLPNARAKLLDMPSSQDGIIQDEGRLQTEASGSVAKVTISKSLSPTSRREDDNSGRVVGPLAPRVAGKKRYRPLSGRSSVKSVNFPVTDEFEREVPVNAKPPLSGFDVFASCPVSSLRRCPGWTNSDGPGSSSELVWKDVVDVEPNFARADGFLLGEIEKIKRVGTSPISRERTAFCWARSKS